MKKNKEHKSQKQIKWFVGGLAGSVGSAVTHPLDLLKVRLQVAKNLKKTLNKSLIQPTSLQSIVATIFRNEGPIGFYRGLSASIFRQLTYSSARFNVYFTLTKKIPAFFNTDKISFVGQMGSACVAGAAGALAGNVFDLLNIRMQSNAGLPLEQKRNYKHAIDGLIKLVRQEGAAACLTGLPTNTQRAIVITIAQLVSYDRAKGFLIKKGFNDGVSTYFLSSMISGLVTVTASNPVDVVKSVIMSSPRGTYNSGFGCALSLLRNHGLFYFLKGWGPSYVRLGPHTVITFMVLEQLKKIPILQKS